MKDLKSKREAAGLSRLQVAIEAGLPYTTAIRVEQGRARMESAARYEAALRRLIKRQKKQSDNR